MPQVKANPRERAEDTRRSPSRLPILSYFGRATLSRARRMRYSFTRENLMATAKTMAWVAPITILIWVYAVREQIVSGDHVQFQITVRSNDPSRVVTVVVPADRNIVCTLQGPQAKLQELQSSQRLQSPLNITLTPDQLSQRRSTISLVSQIKDDPIFKNNGISVLSSSPAELEVAVDQLVEREAVIEPPAGLPGLGTCTFTPAKVQVKGPREVLDSLTRNGRLTLTANMATALDGRRPGDYSNVTVTLQSPGPGVTLLGDSAKVNFRVQEREVKYTIPNLQIKPAPPLELLKTYNITMTSPSPPLIDVIVSGPPEKIDLIKRGEVKPPPEAVLDLTAEDIADAAKSPKTLKPWIAHLPDGVTVEPGSVPDATISAIER